MKENRKLLFFTYLRDIRFGVLNTSLSMNTLTSNDPFLESCIFFFLPLRSIPSIEVLEDRIDLSDMSKNCGGVVINYLEHVEVKVNLNYSRRGDLVIKITSPEGTVSRLTHYRTSDSFFKLKDLNWVLMTLHLWGETAVGEWKLSLENSQAQHQNEGWLYFQSCQKRICRFFLVSFVRFSLFVFLLLFVVVLLFFLVTDSALLFLGRNTF